jgi:hypothetical protein
LRFFIKQPVSVPPRPSAIFFTRRMFVLAFSIRASGYPRESPRDLSALAKSLTELAVIATVRMTNMRMSKS